MTVIDTTKDVDALTVTLTARFDAPPERVWQVWEDPRLLERWWGPPTYPATVLEHDLSPGGRVHYLMTGPGGDQHHGWWRVHEVAAPERLVFEDGFADENGTPTEDGLVTRAEVALRAEQGGTVMTVTSTFPSAEVMEQMSAMGMIEGITEAMNQIDGLLAA
ncbi:SRPBCC domain-containing protein [Nocardioides sp. HDW12B]|uniref:SRPBCC family protein n=1 Tax=Nocardioides sp. HDW12B TaxID=2714939 RepID=UPI00140AAECD|nr:SRPBCC domain-containing protein [Nocardioides sp. HDW12B]QIK65500.1 SRPBCC domain-containing protein [Nocardioides sp. HDW12B]